MPDDPDDEPDERDADAARRAAAHASLQVMLRDRQPRLIATPAILAVIGAIFVMMAAASGSVAFPSQTLLRWGARPGRRSRTANGGASCRRCGCTPISCTSA